MGIAGTVELRDVEVIGASDRGLCCRIDGRNYWISRECLLTGSTVGAFADRGILVVERRFAQDRGLVGRRSRPLR